MVRSHQDRCTWNAHATVYGARDGAGKHQARMRTNNRDGRQSNRIGLEQGVNLLVKVGCRGFVKSAGTRWRTGHCCSGMPLCDQACEERALRSFPITPARPKLARTSSFPIRQSPEVRKQRQELVVAQTEFPAAWMIEALVVVNQECFIDDDAAGSQ